MLPVVVAVAILILSAALALSLGRYPRRASMAGAGGAVLAALIGLISTVKILLYPATETLSFPCSLPIGSFALALDPLSAIFLLPVFILTAAAALYGLDYLKPMAGKKPLGAAWAMFNLLSAAMVLVLLSADAVPFLIGWEMMAAASFALVVFEHEKPQVRKAGLIYLVAGGSGALFLLFMFALLASPAGSLAFSSMVRPGGALASAVFLFAVFGFGLKAGFIPLHIWLPEAHPAAPSHVSAVMSGVMIKMGIYGLLRVLVILGAPEAWWGWLLIIIGSVSAVAGVLFALAQHDLKRLLAWSSIENVGIITMGIGLGVLGQARSVPLLAALGYGGALLHVINHAFFKGLLFMSAGAVLHSAGTLELENLGGLLKKMPFTAFFFFLGSAAACALPPLNGFTGEFLIYLGAFNSIGPSSRAAFPALIVITSLAATGALAVAAFAKAGGSVFLGEPRENRFESLDDAGTMMKIAMSGLATLCALIGLCSPFLLKPLAAAITPLAVSYPLLDAGVNMLYVSAGALTLIALILCAWALRSALSRGLPPVPGVTWDCGYASLTARMQYGASAFTQPLTDFFQPLLRKARSYPAIAEYFPGTASFSTEARAVFYNHLYSPVGAQIKRLAFRYTWLQHGRLQLYILYIVIALIALLVWKL
ncbi:MAG: proton-conducting transporter membrane subunit [Elusimicrobiota bacterium]